MSGVAGGGEKKSSSRSIATKSLVINEYKRRLKDNMRSLIDNLIHIVQAAKINMDDDAHKSSDGEMTEYQSLKNELAVRAALIGRACEALLKLTNDLREFLILHDFNFLTHAVAAAEEECDQKMKEQRAAHNALRKDINDLLTDIDKDCADNFGYRF